MTTATTIAAGHDEKANFSPVLDSSGIGFKRLFILIGVMTLWIN